MADLGLEPAVRTAFDEAARLLEELGHEVEDTPPGLLGPDVLPAFERVWTLSGTLLPVPHAPRPRSRKTSPAEE